MPQIKPSSRFRRKAMLATIPFVVIMFATLWWEDALPEPIRASAVVVILIPCFIGISLVIWRRMARFTCPSCHARIERFMPTGGKPAPPIRYHCHSFDVIWDTGLNTLDD